MWEYQTHVSAGGINLLVPLQMLKKEHLQMCEAVCNVFGLVCAYVTDSTAVLSYMEEMLREEVRLSDPGQQINLMLLTVRIRQGQWKVVTLHYSEIKNSIMYYVQQASTFRDVNVNYLTASLYS